MGQSRIYFANGGAVGKTLSVKKRGVGEGEEVVAGYIDTNGNVELDEGVNLGPEELQKIVDKCNQVREMMATLLMEE